MKDRRKYNAEYQKENMVRYTIKFNKKTDQEYIDLFNSIPNRTEWLREKLEEYAEEIDGD